MERKDVDYAQAARARWGGTAAYKEYETKTAGRSAAELRADGAGLTEILAGFGGLREKTAADPAVRAQVEALRDYITAHFYTCSDAILAGLGQLYAAGGEFTDTIDRAGGPGTAAFAAEAIRLYCRGDGEADRPGPEGNICRTP